jgi:peptidyl-tRNA hydrolase
MPNTISNNNQPKLQDAIIESFQPIPIKMGPKTAAEFHQYEKDTFHQLLKLKAVPCKCGTLFSPNGPGGSKKGNGTRQYRMECKNSNCEIKTVSLRKYLKPSEDKGTKWQVIHNKALENINEMDKLVPLIKSNDSQNKTYSSSNSMDMVQERVDGSSDSDSEFHKQGKEHGLFSQEAAAGPNENDESGSDEECHQYSHESEYESGDSYDNEDENQENDSGRGNKLITPTPTTVPLKANHNRFAILAKRPVELTPEQQAKKSKTRSVHNSEDEDPDDGPSLRELVIGLQRQLKEQQLVIERQQKTIADLTQLLASSQQSSSVQPRMVSQSAIGESRQPINQTEIPTSTKKLPNTESSAKQKANSTEDHRDRYSDASSFNVIQARKGIKHLQKREIVVPLTQDNDNEPMNVPKDRTSWADIAKKGVKNLSKVEKKRVLQGGQERAKPQEFYKVYLQYKARTSSFEDKKKKVQLFMKITKLNKVITDYSMVRDLIEVYVCDAQLQKFSKIINEHKLVIVRDFDPADMTHTGDDERKVTIRAKTIQRLGFLVSKARSENHKEAIMEGFGPDLREEIQEYANQMLDPEKKWNMNHKQQFHSRLHQEVTADMFRQSKRGKEDLATAVGGEASQ